MFLNAFSDKTRSLCFRTVPVGSNNTLRLPWEPGAQTFVHGNTRNYSIAVVAWQQQFGSADETPWWSRASRE